jgi:hypothetical protein
MSVPFSNQVIHEYKIPSTSQFQTLENKYTVLLDGKPASIKILLPYDYNENTSFINSDPDRLMATLKYQAFLIDLKGLHKHYHEKGEWDFNLINKIEKFAEENQSNQKLFAHSMELIHELKTNKYSPREIETFLTWLTVFTENHIHPSFIIREKINSLVEDILTKTTSFTKRSEDDSNNPSYSLIGKEGEILALCKLPRKEFDSSFGGEIPSIKALLAPIWQHDLMAFEQDNLFALQSIPPIVAVEIEREGLIQRGTIQKFIPHTLPANELCYQEGGDALIKSIPIFLAHHLAIESLFLGFAAGHGANYVFQNVDGQLVKGFMIDNKETFIPMNRIKPGTQITCAQELQKRRAELETEIKNLSSKGQELSHDQKLELEKIKQKIATIEKAIIVMRIYILGLPQNDSPMSRALLLTLSHPGFIPLLTQYRERTKNYYQISQEAVDAQLERIQIIQKMCKEELQKEKLQLTPRDLFFEICGGKHLLEIGKQKGYPYMLMFAHLISDPYHYAQKDYSNHDSIPPSTLLEKPKDDKPESLIYFNNIRKVQAMTKESLTESKDN